MKYVEIKFDLHCNWGDRAPSYRIYVDKDLITERTFSWPGFHVFVKENVVVNLDPGFHYIRIENLNPELGKFTVKNLTVDDQPSEQDFIID